jgi:hypothetical protein
VEKVERMLAQAEAEACTKRESRDAFLLASLEAAERRRRERDLRSLDGLAQHENEQVLRSRRLADVRQARASVANPVLLPDPTAGRDALFALALASSSHAEALANASAREVQEHLGALEAAKAVTAAARSALSSRGCVQPGRGKRTQLKLIAAAVPFSAGHGAVQTLKTTQIFGATCDLLLAPQMKHKNDDTPPALSLPSSAAATYKGDTLKQLIGWAPRGTGRMAAAAAAHCIFIFGCFLDRI